jgi:hypothetical protein
VWEAATVSALDDFYEKIERARVHQADLSSRLAEILGDDKQRFILDDESDPDTGRYPVRLFGVPANVPAWRTIIGDCLFNLRSALDHLAWQLVILDGHKPNRDTSFPIRRTPNAAKPLLIPEVGRQDILDPVEAVQPYADTGKPPDPAVLKPLWALHRLNINDKHRLLVVVVYAFDLWQTSSEWSGIGPRPEFYFHPIAVQEEGMVVASFDFHEQQPAEFPLKGGLHLVIDEPELPKLTMIGVERFLDMLIHHVERTVAVNFGSLFPAGTVRPVRPISS